ncbi:MAG: NADH:ubiquinone oxidoreductase [Pseudomonadota bacterium]
MSRQTQNSMLLIGAIAGGIGFTAFVALMVIGEFVFSAALFLAFLVALIVAIFLFRAFHNAVDAPAAVAQPAVAPAPAPAPEPAPVAAEPTPEPVAAAPEQAPEPAPAPVAEAPAAEAASPGTRPASLDGPRDGGADDLKKIKGVGPKLEQLLHRLGFYHFDQIAAWTPDEVAWVDENLEGFKGRVSRDTWVDQAKTLAAGGETDFSQKVEKGDVY